MSIVATHLRRKLVSSRHAFTQSMGYASTSKIKEITSTSEWDELIKNSTSSGRPTIVEFTAVWCPPCKMIAPVLEELAGKHTDLDFVKLDIDNHAITNIVADHSVAAVPTFVSLKGEKKVHAFSGADRNQLQKMVEDLSDL
jgi:thioredoxin 1